MNHIKKEDLLLVFDNASSHVDTFSGWWNRYIPGVKLTISPYSPEFNPIERLFRTISIRFPDLYKNENLFINLFLIFNMFR